MKLTVISAAFNVISSAGEEKLERAIRSVAAVPIEHEHLIFDGASTDGTVEVLRKFEAEIPSLRIVSEKDSGIYEALNKGLRAARGEYIYVIGLDDNIVNPELLASYVSEAVDNHVDMVISPVAFDGGTYPRKLSRVYEHVFRHSYSHQGELISRGFIASHPELMFDESYRIAADYKQAILCHLLGANVLVKTQPFAEFFRGGLSTNMAKRGQEEMRLKKEIYKVGDGAVERTRLRNLPLRVILRCLKSRSVFTRKMGWRSLKFSFWNLVIEDDKKSLYIFGINKVIWCKTKDNTHSRYYLLGITIFKHRNKRKSRKV